MLPLRHNPEIYVLSIVPFVDEGLGNSSYLVEIGERRALVVDPPRDVRPFLALARDRGLALSHSLETHLHADFVSGSRELAAAGATVLAPEGARLGFGHVALAADVDIEVGGLNLRPLATPGHTPEHLSYLLLDGDAPLALFSGGALIPGGVARTDLIADDQTEPLARSLFRALNERLLSLPDDLPVYPTHGAGSFCSTATRHDRTTTIGRERATNPLLRAASEDEFVDRLLQGLGSYPEYFRRLREVNREGPRTYGSPPTLPALSADAFERLIEAGGEPVDVRPIEAFAAGHVAGSLSIELRPAFASWLGWLVTADRPLLFVLDADQDRSELVRQAIGIGYERLEGELAGGIEAWSASGRPLARVDLTRSLDQTQSALIDVRQLSEYRSGHIPGAISVELGDLAGSAMSELPSEATFMCGHGERAMTAASLAQRADHGAAVFVGGPRDWSRQTGNALVRG
jgi:hydroxyacylglutathione hydrolase